MSKPCSGPGWELRQRSGEIELRKFRREQLQSQGRLPNIWGNAQIFSHIWLCNCSLLIFLIYEESFLFFLSVKYGLWIYPLCSHASYKSKDDGKLYLCNFLSACMPVSVVINRFYPKTGAWEVAENLLAQLAALALVINTFLLPHVFYRVDVIPPVFCDCTVYTLL